MGDAAADFDGRGFREDQPGPEEARQMLEVPVVGQTAAGRILAHGRYDDAVGELDPAELQGREQQRRRGTVWHVRTSGTAPLWARPTCRSGAPQASPR